MGMGAGWNLAGARLVGLGVKLTLLAAAAASIPLLSGCGSSPEPAAQDVASTPSVLIEDAWVRATVGAKDPSMTAAFMSLTNPGNADIKLTSATSPVAGMVELHGMASKDGKLVMQKKAGGVNVPAGSHAHLSPGGDHIMLMNLEQALKPGDELPLTLKFSDHTTRDLTLPVKTFTEEEEHYHPTQTPSPE